MRIISLLSLAGFSLMLSACSSLDRVSKIGEAPQLTQIENPTTKAEYQPVSLPMPAPKNENKQMNSLWAANRTTFFKDQRAADIGDIITVLIDIDDEAELENETQRTRNSNENADTAALAGYESARACFTPSCRPYKFD